MLKLKVAICGWIGTVTDSAHWAYHYGVLAVFEHYGIAPPSFETYLAEISAGPANFFRNHGITAPADWRTPIMIYENSLARHRNAICLRDGTRELLAFLHHRPTKIVILGGGFADEVVDGIDHCGIAHLISHIEPLAFDLEDRFRSILYRLGANASETIYVGSGVRELCAAKMFGIESVAVAGSFEQSEKRLRDSSDHFVNTPREALGFLKTKEVP
jgi:phosphoglycolate phosphatase-like HAD superfamily hydrolase